MENIIGCSFPESWLYLNTANWLTESERVSLIQQY